MIKTIMIILPIVLRIVLFALEKSKQNDTVKDLFLRFIAHAQENNIAVKLHDSYTEKIKEIKESEDLKKGPS